MKPGPTAFNANPSLLLTQDDRPPFRRRAAVVLVLWTAALALVATGQLVGIAVGALMSIALLLENRWLHARLQCALEMEAQREADLSAARAAAEGANASKAVFLANMSHEIRTPMNAIIGLTQLALRTPLDQRQRDYLTQVSTSSRALLVLLNDVLDYSKIEAGRLALEREEFSPEETIEAVGNLFAARLDEAGLELYYEIADDVPQRLVGDSRRLAQVLDTLIGNALQSTPRGEIVVTVRTRARDADGVRLQFSVSDTGIGLATDQARGLFDAFGPPEPTKTRGPGGAGLGLALCKRLVEMMDGTIGVRGAPGQGCTFDFDVRFDLPGLRRERDLHGVRGLRALVLEEQDTGRLILQQHFQSWRVQVALARDLDDARQKLRRVAPGEPYDIVVTDWKAGGNALAQWAQALAAERGDRAPAVVVLAPLSACDEASQAVTPWAATSGVLARPVTPSRLFETIVRLRAGTQARPLPEPAKDLALSDLMRTLRGAHVLLVEDNIVNQQVGEAFLFVAGLRVTLAENGLEAIERVKETLFDAVLMDLQMPVMDGDEATRMIRSLPGRARMPIIAMSAAATEEDRQLCLASGMDAHLGKPVDSRELARVLLAWIPARVREDVAATAIDSREAPDQDNA